MTKTEAAAAGFRLSALTLAPEIGPILVDLNHVLYHQKHSITTVPLGLLLSLIFLALPLSIVLFLLSRLPNGRLKRVVIALLCLPPLQLTRQVLLRVAGAAEFARMLHFAIYAIVLGLLVLALRSPELFQSMVTRSRFLYTGAAIFALIVAGQLLRAAEVSYQVSNRPLPRLAPAFPNAAAHRVIWIVFDELSYDQVLGSRPAGLDLPHFQTLQHASVSFRNVTPAGYWTELAVPSLLTGSVIKDIEPAGARGISIQYTGASEDVPFDPNATIFGKLRQMRMNSGVVGWFNPYCDLLAPVLTSCVWESDTPVLPRTKIWGVSGSQTVLKNSLAALRHRFGTARPIAGGPDERKPSYDALMPAATDAIRNPATALLFIHLPLPHAPGFYNRRLHAFSSSGTYLDNLVLADITLDTLLRAVENSSTAELTTVIVSSDHSWRIDLWKAGPHWSMEEANASVRGFDPRIPLLVHFPGQRKELDIDTPFQAVRTGSLIELLLRGMVSDPDAVGGWAQREY